jgi:hypothetical protein
MRFLANENFPGDAVAALRVLGHDCEPARVRMRRIGRAIESS